MIHAITSTWAFDEAKKREALSRSCPKCSRRQVAGEEKINEPVACENCGEEIPPPGSPHSRSSSQMQGDGTGEELNIGRKTGQGLW